MYRYQTKHRILSLLLVFSLLVLTGVTVFPSPASAAETVWWEWTSPPNPPIILDPFVPFNTPVLGMNVLNKLILQVEPPMTPVDITVELLELGLVWYPFVLHYEPGPGWSSVDYGITVMGTSDHIEVVIDPPYVVTNIRLVNESFEPVIVNSIQFVAGMPEKDFGDAPDPAYPTLLASNGASHQQPSALFLGASVDIELDGQPDANALGDDINGDDEDGVAFTSSLVPGNTANVSVVASAAGLLDAWLDITGDGDWNDAGEQIFTSQPLVAGVNNLSFPVHAGADTGPTFARFRVSSNGGLSFDGPALDGEVEDYEVQIGEPEPGSGWTWPGPVTVNSQSPICEPVIPSMDVQKLIIELVPQSFAFFSVELNTSGPMEEFVTLEYDLGFWGSPTGHAITFSGTRVEVIFDPPLPGVDGVCVYYNQASLPEIVIDPLQLLPPPSNQPPVADAGGPYNGVVGLAVNLDGSGSYDPDEPSGDQIVSWEWELTGDGLYDDFSGESFSCAWYIPFSGTIGLKVTDTHGAWHTDEAEVNITSEGDYGDAPDPAYPTLLSSNGARHHQQPSAWFLGSGVDSEPDGQPDAFASGDDSNGVDDEDGVTFTTSLVPGNTAGVDVVASAVGLLEAWLDFNGDGDWSDPDEQIFDGRMLIAGVNNLSFPVPAGADTGLTFARFRFSNNVGLSFDGPATNGEVEDYEVRIGEPPPPNLPPVADADGPYNGVVGVPVSLDGSGSSDPDDNIILYEWDFDGDGVYDYSSPTDPITTHAYGSPVVYSAKLRVTDDGGLIDTDTTTVDIGEEPPAPLEVGGEVYPVNKVGVLAPWIALSAAILAGAAIVVRRRRVRS